MAHGSPDWHQLADVDILAQSIGDVHINVAGQDLSEIINRPTYGASVQGSLNNSVSASSTKSLLTVYGTGIIYGGVLRAVGSVAHNQDKVKMIVDGATLTTLDFLDLLDYGVTNNFPYPLSLLLFDEINYFYGVGFNFGITFETSVEIQYTNYVASGVSTQGYLIYAVI